VGRQDAVPAVFVTDATGRGASFRGRSGGHQCPAGAARSVRLGHGWRRRPRCPLYMGSDAWRAVPRPYFDWRRPGSPESFHGARDGTGIALFDNGVVAVGPVGLPPWPRKEAYNASLNGLGNVGFTAQVAGFMDHWAMPWLRTPVYNAVGGWRATSTLLGQLTAFSNTTSWSEPPHRRQW
jgi:hypothetical protein